MSRLRATYSRTFGRALPLRCIAEGVETAAQVELLRAWGCRYVQGYYFARPRSAARVTPLLR